ncbi:hypothetical protein NL676_030719 [Syzygium grande]|nr:hypothetical protein NL676_030719 [Syzygium grande]
MHFKLRAQLPFCVTVTRGTHDPSSSCRTPPAVRHGFEDVDEDALSFCDLPFHHIDMFEGLVTGDQVHPPTLPLQDNFNFKLSISLTITVRD